MGGGIVGVEAGDPAAAAAVFAFGSLCGCGCGCGCEDGLPAALSDDAGTDGAGRDGGTGDDAPTASPSFLSPLLSPSCLLCCCCTGPPVADAAAAAAVDCVDMPSGVDAMGSAVAACSSSAATPNQPTCLCQMLPANMVSSCVTSSALSSVLSRLAKLLPIDRSSRTRSDG